MKNIIELSELVNELIGVLSTKFIGDFPGIRTAMNDTLDAYNKDGFAVDDAMDEWASDQRNITKEISDGISKRRDDIELYEIFDGVRNDSPIKYINDLQIAMHKISEFISVNFIPERSLLYVDDGELGNLFKMHVNVIDGGKFSVEYRIPVGIRNTESFDGISELCKWVKTKFKKMLSLVEQDSNQKIVDDMLDVKKTPKTKDVPANIESKKKGSPAEGGSTVKGFKKQSTAKEITSNIASGKKIKKTSGFTRVLKINKQKDKTSKKPHKQRVKEHFGTGINLKDLLNEVLVEAMFEPELAIRSTLAAMNNKEDVATIEAALKTIGTTVYDALRNIGDSSRSPKDANREIVSLIDNIGAHLKSNSVDTKLINEFIAKLKLKMTLAHSGMGRIDLTSYLK